MDDQGVRRAAGLLGIGGVLLILRLPWLGLVGWVAGSVVVVVGALSMRRAMVAAGPSAALDVAVVAAIAAPILELLAVGDLARWAGLAGLVRVGGALLVSWTAAHRLEGAGRHRTARRWSGAFVSQLAVWVPLAVHVAASTAREDSVSVEGTAAVGVFALAAVPLGVLFWSAAASEEEQVATVVTG